MKAICLQLHFQTNYAVACGHRHGSILSERQSLLKSQTDVSGQRAVKLAGTLFSLFRAALNKDLSLD